MIQGAQETILATRGSPATIKEYLLAGGNIGKRNAFGRTLLHGSVRCHICAGTGLTPATSAPGLASPLPHLHCDWMRRSAMARWRRCSCSSTDAPTST
jgi:hypothetical protein